MATGPDHYREAERLLAVASQSTETTFEGHNPEADRTIAEAQVHATLALTAATAMQAPVDDCAAGMTVEDWDAWHKAAGTTTAKGALR
jgi:hypothetical protein